MQIILIDIKKKQSKWNRTHRQNILIKQRGYYWTIIKKNNKEIYRLQKDCKNDREIFNEIRYAKKNKYRYELIGKQYERDSTYRKKWFATNKSRSGYYLCTYCGFPVHRKKITVDHIIPIQKVKESEHYRKLLKRKGCDNVNDLKNLCGACWSCNCNLKKAKAGIWIFIGYLFKHKWINRIRFYLICLFIADRIYQYYLIFAKLP